MPLLSAKGEHRISKWKALEIILSEPFILYMRNQIWTICSLPLYKIFALKIFLNIVMIWNIKTYFSKIEILWGENFCAYSRQKVFQILNPLKDIVLDLDSEDVYVGVSIEGVFSPFASLPISNIIAKIQDLRVERNLEVYLLKPPNWQLSPLANSPTNWPYLICPGIPPIMGLSFSLFLVIWSKKVMLSIPLQIHI